TAFIPSALHDALPICFPADYGDVDVLAGRADTDRVLLIECKDVQHRKNEGEIAEQLSDFRGEVKPDGKPDLLLKHLKRVALIQRSEERRVGKECRYRW